MITSQTRQSRNSEWTTTFITHLCIYNLLSSRKALFFHLFGVGIIAVTSFVGDLNCPSKTLGGKLCVF